MSDPRDPNCRAYQCVNGRVTGVALDYLPLPATRFELKRISFLSDAESGGQTVARIRVLDKEGEDYATLVVLAYPWCGDKNMANQLPPGNSAYPVQHMITNGYPAGRGDHGPLAIYVATPGNPREPASDVIGGLGLPDNQHVCFDLLFKERGSPNPDPQPDPDPDPQPDPDPTDATLLAALARINATLREAFRLTEQ